MFCPSPGHYSTHPADRAVSVLPAITTPFAAGGLQRSPKPRRLKPRDPEARTFTRLIDCCRILPDLAADVIYPRPGGRDKPQGEKEVGAVSLIAPQCPISLPTCCLYHQHQVHCVVVQHRQYLYNSPEPSTQVTNDKYDRLQRLCKEGAASNDRGQYPLSAVGVRWHATTRYNADDLATILGRYGDVTSVDVTSDRSAVAVFSEMTESCDVVRRAVIGPCNGRLYCHWLHRSMLSRRFMGTKSGLLRATNNDYVRPSK